MIAAIQKGHYKSVGQLVAYLIVHGGPIPSFFSETLFSLLIGESVDVRVDAVHDKQLRERIMQVKSCDYSYASNVNRIFWKQLLDSCEHKEVDLTDRIHRAVHKLSQECPRDVNIAELDEPRSISPLYIIYLYIIFSCCNSRS